MIYCNQVENELRHESQRLLNAQIDLQNAANLRSDLERRVRLYEAQEEDAKDKADKEMDKLKVFSQALPFSFQLVNYVSLTECNANGSHDRTTILMSWY